MSYRKSGIIDTRDLHERLEELQGLRDEAERIRGEIQETKGSLEKLRLSDNPSDSEIECLESELSELQGDLESAEIQFDDEEQEELAELEALESEVSEWRDGATLIPESEFTDYCKELLEDCGDLPRNLPNYIAIDWDRTADNLRADYSEVEYQGTTYLVRN